MTAPVLPLLLAVAQAAAAAPDPPVDAASLRAALAHEDSGVRRQAARDLGAAPADRQAAAEALEPLLDDVDWGVRWGAARSLSLLAPDRDAAALVARLVEIRIVRLDAPGSSEPPRVDRLGIDRLDRPEPAVDRLERSE